MKIVGITGSIASGKSEMSKYIASKNFKIIDADYVSKNLTKKGSKGYKKVVEQFENILDSIGNIDRKLLSNIVFNDEKKLQLLNSLLHPVIFEEIDFEIEKYKDEDILFLDAPLLFETGLDTKCQETILVYCNDDIQLQRIIERDNVDVEKAKSIISKQMPVFEKKKRSTYKIENNDSLEELYLKIDVVLDIIRSKKI